MDKESENEREGEGVGDQWREREGERERAMVMAVREDVRRGLVGNERRLINWSQGHCSNFMCFFNCALNCSRSRANLRLLPGGD